MYNNRKGEMIEIEISKTRSRSILSDKVSKGLFRAVFSNFHDYLDLFVHKLYASQGRQSHPYKCHRGRRKKGEGRYVRGKEREERRKETTCGVVAKARPEVVPSGSLVGLTCWTTSWPEVYHTPTMAATKTTKASFCPVLSLLLNVCLLDQRFRLPSSSHHPSPYDSLTSMIIFSWIVQRGNWSNSNEKIRDGGKLKKGGGEEGGGILRTGR